MAHDPLTELEQDQLDWISRFADRVRLNAPRFAAPDCGDDLNEIARSLWERGSWRNLAPESAAERWLEEQPRQ